MNKVVSISFKIVEPMMFRGPGEFDPFVRGTYSRAMTLAMPSPSTIAGTLATYCVSVLGKPVSDSGDWIERYHAILGNDVQIRGPLIKFGNELRVEDKLSQSFLAMKEIKQKCEKVYRKLSQKPNSLRELDEYLKREKEPDEFPKEKRDESNFKARKSMRIGVRLETRTDPSLKTAKEGFLYSAEYLDYKAVGNRNRETSVEIVAEIRGKIVENLFSAQALPVRLGGEGRVALLSFQQGEKILEEIRKQLWNGREEHSGSLALYLATPALFKGGRRVEEYVRDQVENMDCKFEGISGESTVLGAGFMIGEGKRKPIYTSLNPGSIIFLRGNFNLLEIYQNKSLSEASTLGYGTIIPIPLL